MTENLGTATLDLEGDLTPLGKSIDKAKRDAQTGAKGIGASFKSGVKTAIIPAVAALGALAVGAKKTIDASSDLTEQQNKANVVFGEGEAIIRSFAENAAQNFGLSERAALEFAGVFGNMLVPMGFARKEAAMVSQSLLALSADMASFNNASPEEVLEAMRAGLSGESEPLRRFGVFLNEARVQAEALSLGLVKTTKDTSLIRAAQIRASLAQRAYTKAVGEHGEKSDEARKAQASMIGANKALEKATKGVLKPLTAEQKAKATLSLITKDTADAQGDFARTSDSAANAEKIQAAETENLNAKIGQGLMPLYQSLQQILLRVTGFMAEHTTAVKIGAAVIAVLALGILGLNAAVGIYTLVTSAATASTIAWTLALLANPIFLIIVGLIALGVAFVVAYKKSERFRAVVQGVFAAVQGAVAAFVGFFTTKIPAGFNKVLGALQDWGGRVRSFLTGLPGRLASAALGVGTGIKDRLLRGLAGLGAGLLSAVRGAVNGVLGIIRGFRIPGFSVDPAGRFGPTISFGGFSPFAGIPTLATGVLNFPGGPAIVGERGPELVNLPGGSDVISASRTRRMLGDGGFTLVNVMELDGEVVYRNQRQVDARHIRRNGGG